MKAGRTAGPSGATRPQGEASPAFGFANDWSRASVLLVASKFFLRFPQTYADAEAVQDPPTASSGSAQSWKHQGLCKCVLAEHGSTVKSVKAR